METEAIDKLFLELSQVTTATTQKELTLAALVRRLMRQLPLPHNRSQFQRALVAEARAYLLSIGQPDDERA